MAQTKKNPKSNHLKDELKRLSKKEGADLFGVADLSVARDFIVQQGGELMGSFPRAVSLGMRISDTVLETHSPEEPHAMSLYAQHIYDVVSPALNVVATRLAQHLERSGYRALPVPATKLYTPETLRSRFSHKLPAHLSGLGWIGKSCLLINPQYGPRVRWVSILTDAPLTADAPLDKGCGTCRICAETCPSGAFTGKEFSPSDPVEARFDRRKCHDYRVTHPCGMCVLCCPVGKRKKAKF
jgi:epoxyqueuosine reductase